MPHFYAKPSFRSLFRAGLRRKITVDNDSWHYGAPSSRRWTWPPHRGESARNCGIIRCRKSRSKCKDESCCFWCHQWPWRHPLVGNLFFRWLLNALSRYCTDVDLISHKTEENGNLVKAIGNVILMKEISEGNCSLALFSPSSAQWFFQLTFEPLMYFLLVNFIHYFTKFRSVLLSDFVLFGGGGG